MLMVGMVTERTGMATEMLRRKTQETPKMRVQDEQIHPRKMMVKVVVALAKALADTVWPRDQREAVVVNLRKVQKDHLVEVQVVLKDSVDSVWIIDQVECKLLPNNPNPNHPNRPQA